jgi:tight adherence protein C
MDAIVNIVQGFLGQSGAATSLFIVLAAGAGFALAMGVSAFAVGLFDPVRKRLGKVSAEDDQAPAFIERMVEKLRPLAAAIRPKNAREHKRIERLLVHAGYRSANARTLYFGVKALAIILLPCAVLLASPFLPSVSTTRLMIYAVAAGYLGSLLCSMWLDHQVAARQRAIRTGFPDALDLLVVCVESGLGMAPALARVADELSVSHPALGEELALVNAEIRAGVERGVALKNLSDRTGLDDIRGLTALLVQTMRFGTSVAEALRVYSEEFRDKRTQAAEEQAAKIGTKMIFPLVLFLFPSFFLVAIGPAVIGLIDVFSQMAG